MRTRIIITILLWLSVLPNAWSQGSGAQQKFFVQGRLINDKPVFKIIPGSSGAWFLGTRNGYRVYVATKEGNSFGEFKLYKDKLKPASAAQFMSVTTEKEYAEAMRKIVYEESYSVAGNSFDDMNRASNKMNLLFLSYVLVSSYDPQLSEMSGLQFEYPEGFEEELMIKVEIIGFESFSHVQVISKSTLYSEIYSPNFDVKLGDIEITFQWNHEQNEDLFLAYQLERSSDGFNFEKIGIPLFFNTTSPGADKGLIIATDSVPENYTPYWYRVRGYDAFGYMSKPGDALSVNGLDLTSPDKPGYVDVEHVSDSIAKVTWKHQTCDDMAGFQVIGATKETGTYTLLHDELLSPDVREFDYNLSNGVFRYFRVLAVDTAQNAAASDLGLLILYDTIPPILPDSISAVADTNRVVTITWNPSPSPDIKAYRLFKSYGSDHNFIPITPVPVVDTFYTDTINGQRLEKKVYYQLIALDQNYNHSKPSEPIIALIPDTVPPTKTILTEAILNDAGNPELTWYASSSDDVAGYLVYRRTNADSILTVIDSLPADQLFYEDKDYGSKGSQMGEYYITAYDSAGNESGFSNGKRVFKKFEKYANQISILSANNENNQVKLTWQYSSTNAYGVLVYRSVEGKGFTLIDRVDSGNEYLDKKVKLGKKYAYKIGVIETNGVQYPLSAEYSVKLK